MLTTNDWSVIRILTILCVLMCIFLRYISKTKKKKQLEIAFAGLFILFIFWMLNLILQLVCSKKFGINPMIFEKLIYVSTCLMPVVFLLMSLIFARTKIELNKKIRIIICSSNINYSNSMDK